MEKGHTFKQLFVGGDLSGIQKFLYTISSKKAAVSLKGRSFYLQKYMENTCDGLKTVVLDAGSQTANAIYCSGGKFYMLADYSPEIVTAIDEYTIQVKTSLWEEHKGQLGINIAYVPFTENPDGTVECDGLECVKPGILWKIVNADFYQQKNQKCKDFLQSEFASFFEPIPVGGIPKVCAVTGIESADCVLIDLGSDTKSYVLPSVDKQIKLGEELRKVNHFRTFEEYAGDTDLGILRMDVDGLGKRFIEGFDSIGEYQRFSVRLVDFFEKEVQKIQQEPSFRDYLNIIYAGGDDIFIVGRWDKVIDMAERIHKETEARFKSDGISISGGVAVVQPRFPIAKAAQLAGEAESAAKSFRGGEKNAFHMLGKTVSWDGEFEFVKSFKQQFVSLIEDFGLSKSILHKIMLYSSIADLNRIRRREGKSEDYSYVWHISYYLTRYIERYKSNEAISVFCRTLRDKELTSKNGRSLELIALAARWAELLLKDKVTK